MAKEKVGKKRGGSRGKLKIVGGETMGEKKVSKKMCK